MFNKTKSSNKFTPSAQAALALARQEAQSLHRTYIGTEHVLLGLVLEESGIVANVLGTFNVSTDKIKLEIEKLIQHGPENALSGDLSLTPQANRAMDIAADEARNLNQNSIGPEHVLLGLILEGSGVAAQVLQNLELKLADVGREAFKTRILQMKIVESVVRPVRATIAGKRKMREELLAHFTAIYDDEFARLHDSAKAIKQAQQRFGDPAELAHELNSAVPATERIGCYSERLFGWRAPETVTRYLLRQARITFFVIAAIGCGPVVLALWNHWSRSEWLTLRPLAAALLLTPAAQFVLGMLYFKMRDSLLGVFGKRKSTFRALLFDAAMALFVVAVGYGFMVASTGDYAKAFLLLFPVCLAGFAVAAAFLLLALFRGPTEIRDTVWALLDLKQISAE